MRIDGGVMNQKGPKIIKKKKKTQLQSKSNNKQTKTPKKQKAPKLPNKQSNKVLCD